MAIDKKKFLEMMKNPSALSAADVNVVIGTAYNL